MLAQASGLDRAAISDNLQRLVRGIEIYHPQPYHYTDSLTIATLRQQLAEELTSTPSARETYATYVRLACAFGDAHTRVWASKVTGAYRDQARHLPLEVDVLADDHLVIRADYRGGKSDLTGQRILAINNVTAPQLAATLRQYASRETDQLDRIQLSGRFAYFLWLVYGWEDFTLELASGARQIAGLSGKDLSANRPPRPKRPVVLDSLLDKRTAYLRVRHFEGRVKFYKKKFKRVFRNFRAAGVDRLILDLRGHDGGDSRVGEELARYLAKEPFRPFAYSYWKATPAFKQNFKEIYIPGAIRFALPLLKNFHPHLRAIYRAEDHALARVEYPLNKPYGPGKAFAGEVVLLTDENTFSAGTCFAALFKDNSLGKIVGRPSGNLANFHADGLVRIRLGEGVNIQISSSYLVRPSGDEKPAPVQPDVLLAPGEDALHIVRSQPAKAFLR
ncbi:MAG: S41 family peptidase [Bacteroidota bacterium]